MTRSVIATNSSASASRCLVSSRIMLVHRHTALIGREESTDISKTKVKSHINTCTFIYNFAIVLNSRCYANFLDFESFKTSSLSTANHYHYLHRILCVIVFMVRSHRTRCVVVPAAQHNAT